MSNSIAQLVVPLVIVAIGAALGVAAATIAARSRMRIQLAEFEAERATWGRREAEVAAQLSVTHGELKAETRAHDATRMELAEERRVNGQLDKTVQPLRTAVDELGKRVGEAEAARLRARTELQAQITQMGVKFGEATASVQQEARRLSQALTRSERRGSWGEMQLKRLVEASGMIENVHFVTQDRTTTDDGTWVPDMIIDLAGGRKVVVDAKVSLDAFLALEQEPGSQEMFKKHADAVISHVDRLSRKEYWKRYESPEFVVLFLPAEALLQPALEVRPDLLQYSFEKRIVLATPTTLMALLRTISFAWQQADVAAQAKEIQSLGAEMYERLLRMAEHFDSLGKSIGMSVNRYNATIGSLESRVLPAARRFQPMSATSKDLPKLPGIDNTIRPLLPELQLNAEIAQPDDGSGDDSGDDDAAEGDTGPEPGLRSA
ncbi:MAG: DNA recombination protein RmuC [Candidatus Nanopelagicales bacterium]|nr:DNA recombination protein RmuC [Candidatus Nanopelagicales bacterium]MDZ4249314.1 DNA recombination protein RmuC [Candidatus Nanopelagicales bacterium]